MTNKNIYNSAVISLFSQLVIGILCLLGFYISLSEKDEVLYSLLTMETIVQIIELVFYIWLISNITSINYDMTYIRYFDWFLTTPTMLVTLAVFMIYMSSTDKIEFKTTIEENKDNLLLVVLLNSLMLFIGLLGEIQILPTLISFGIASVFLCLVFYNLYINYVNNNERNSNLLLITFIVWSLYGVAFLLPYHKKNIMYNILDIFSKNVNGLFLVLFMLYISSQ